MDIKYLDETGLKKVFEIVNEKDTKLENDVTLILNGITQELENKANKSDIPEISDTVVNADWDAEEDENGFIRNKPFGEGLSNQLLIEYEVSNLIQIDYDWFSGYINNVTFPVIEENTDYIVCINETEYNVKGRKKEGYINSVLSNAEDVNINSNKIGDFLIYNSAGISVGLYVRNYKNFNLKIYKVINGVKQLDSKYLPIVQETGDSETSIMSQKAVTEALPKNWVGTQEEYDAIQTKDSNTFYFIKEEE